MTSQIQSDMNKLYDRIEHLENIIESAKTAVEKEQYAAQLVGAYQRCCARKLGRIAKVLEVGGPCKCDCHVGHEVISDDCCEVVLETR